MNAVDKVKIAIDRYEEVVAEEKRLTGALETASTHRRDLCTEVIRQMFNVCPGKVIHRDGKQYEVKSTGTTAPATLTVIPSTHIFLETDHDPRK